MVDYSPLWDTMRKRGITQYMNMNITLITLERICTYLDCTPNDVIRFTE